MKGKVKSLLSCVPEVVCLDIVPAEDEFIFLSTDGILDVTSIKNVVPTQCYVVRLCDREVGAAGDRREP